MKRVTANLDEAQYRWLAEFADENDESLSGAVGLLIDKRRSGEAPNEASVKHEAENEALADRVADLEARVRSLESDAHDDGSQDTPDPPDTTEPRPDTGDAVTAPQAPRDTVPQLDGDVPDDVDAAIADLELPPPRSVDIEARYEALRQAWLRVRALERAEASDLKELYPEYAAGLGSVQSWYENLISPHLRELPGVEHTGSTRKPWKSISSRS